MIKSVTVWLMCGLWLSAQAELRLPSIFSDGMVLQRNMPAPVWGWADSGVEVTVEFAGQTKTGKAGDDGKWIVTLDPMNGSSSPRNMTICSSLATRQYSNVLVGEVWLLAGQSNMGWRLAKSDGGEEAIGMANYPWLRNFRQLPNQGVCDTPAEDVKGGQWVVCAPDNAPRLSGIGFFFARALYPHLEDVPIALIDTAMGGTYAECWIDRQTLERTPSTFSFLDKAVREIKPGESDPKGEWGENNFRRPAGLFNGKVAPIQPFAVRGVLWYQGENNSKNWLVGGYAETLTALIQSWRGGFQQPELSFLIVQLPRYSAGNESDWPLVRAAQSRVAAELPNVGMVVTIDCGEETQIHPTDKQTVGERLALLARAKVYGQSVPFSGPVFQALASCGSSLLVRFESADGLNFTGGEVKGFEICGADKRFVSAQAKIMPDGTVKVFNPAVREPVMVRYGWFNWGEVNLFNAIGLPAAPFSAGIGR